MILPGSSTSSPVVIDTFFFKVRRTSCPRGTISLLIHTPNIAQPSPKMIGHLITLSTFTPQARMAAISLSADMREKTSTLDTRIASGIVHCSVSGKQTAANSPTRLIGTPSSM